MSICYWGRGAGWVRGWRVGGWVGAVWFVVGEGEEKGAEKKRMSWGEG